MFPAQTYSRRGTQEKYLEEIHKVFVCGSLIERHTHAAVIEFPNVDS
jgi:hypothetical protein